MEYAKELKAAKAVARKAGAVMLQYFNGDQQTEFKSDNSPVTTADRQINRLVIAELQKEFDDIIIGEEESTGEYGMGRRWICDPIDGTKAYTWGVPTAMFSLALVIDGKPQMGVAYDPFLNKLYEACVGMGSYCNGKKLSVSQKGITEGYTAVTSNVDEVAHAPGFIFALEKKGVRFSAFSGAVYKMCLIAAGRLLGYAERKVNAHDVAAAHVIVTEAGGMISDLAGGPLDYSKPFKGAILSNSAIHADLVECYQSNA